MEKTNQTEFRAEKVIKRKGDKLYAKWNGYDNSFNNWIDKKVSSFKMSCFPEPYTCSKDKVELDLSIYASKSNLESATDVNTSKSFKEVDLDSLKSYYWWFRYW